MGQTRVLGDFLYHRGRPGDVAVGHKPRPLPSDLTHPARTNKE